MRYLGLFLGVALLASGQQKRPLEIKDSNQIRTVADPQISPDGKRIAYTVGTIDIAGDKSDNDVWMVNWDGTGLARVTTSKESESAPRWSPDGRHLGFLSNRADKEKGTQLWLMPLSGGEAEQVTHIEGNITEYAWSPDGKKLALAIEPKEDEPKKDADGKPKTAKPIVIDRYRFKQDIEGYLNKGLPKLWLFDLETKKAERLTTEKFAENSASWSPDGSRVAYVSERAGAQGHYPKWALCVADAKPGASVRVLTDDERLIAYRGIRPHWSSDGSRLYLLTGREPKFRTYNRLKVASVPATGGTVRIVTPSLDHSVAAFLRLSNGELGFTVVDDMTELPYRMDEGGTPKRIVDGKTVVAAITESAGHFAVLASNDNELPEIYATENGKLRRLTNHNTEWLKSITVGETREVRYKTPDGAEAHGILTLPPGYVDGSRKLPLLLRIHGGPNGQDGHAFSFERQLFAANGYAVLNVNYRGSAGRDEPYQTAIFADWGNKEVVDLLAGVDHVISLGIADPNRLGIGGWSYGGILTNYTIPKDKRFKAAVSGAGSSLQLSMYGSDQYVEQYDLEVGAPWKARDTWLKMSYPFFEADKIKTPTLFMGGEKDFNVPIIGSEQMYQALRANDVDSQLVVYPGEFHSIKKPSYVIDRYERYLAWYGKYLGMGPVQRAD